MRAVSTADNSSPQPSKSRTEAEHGVTRTDVNFVLDAVMLTVFCLLMGVSAIIRFVFPRASAAIGWRLWGHSLDDWSDLQFAIVALLTALILVHLMLHWTWVCGVISNRLGRRQHRVIRLDDGNRTLYGVGLLIVIVNLLGVLIAAAALMIHAPGERTEDPTPVGTTSEQ